MLGDAAGLAGDDVGAADRVEQRGLAVVDMAHDRDHRRARLQRLGAHRRPRPMSMSTSPSLTRLMRVAELGDQQLGGVLVDRLGDGDRHAHLEQRLDQVGAALGHAVGEFLHGDRLGDDDVADLLGRRAGLHVVALFLLAGAAERGERAGAAVVLVGKGAGDGELAAMAAIVVAAAASGGRARGASARAHGRRGGGTARSSSSSRLGDAAARRGAGCGFGGAARFFLGLRGALPRRLLPRPCDSLRRGGVSSSVCSTLAAVLAAARFLERGQARFLGLAQQLRPAVPCGAVMSSPARRLARLPARARPASAPASGARRRARAWAPRRAGFARAAEDAALLDLDDDRVRAAVAEALLDLAGLDRALEAQRRPGAKLRLFGLVCHSIPSSNLVSRAGPRGGFAAF